MDIFISILIGLFFAYLIWRYKRPAPPPESENTHTQEKHEETKMDKKIKKVLSKEKGAVKETKSLLKMDKKQDKKMAELKKMEKHKKKK